ncbi:unnamed protein product [Darwinula stevensoni]|uniref:Oplophorus-luciferin 2-monooxygenase non-catalytic subunit n=1 Tax=Darwinula stevensoni TaxID=69355 RepID=A0A7R8WZ78_9CRUS|nr:unnamed protein product [Darwinula stevensoni]CAG0880251.1 unnamed protein product [Darwinula stevensoni]
MRRFGSCDLVASRFLAFLPFLTLSSGSTGESLCPAPDPISPCTCESNGIVDCSRANTSEEISSAFGNVTWPSTRLSVFRLMNNEGVKCLPEGIFGNVSFQEIHVLRTGLVTVDPSALLTSKDRLEYLSISNSLLEEFPFHILPRMTHLATLRLASNALRRVPALASSSLRDVMLFGNRIDALEPGWSTPGLESLDISYNPVYKLIPGLFEGMPNFKSFLASACNLGPVLLNGTLAFHSDALIAVFLQDNNIERLEPGAITGLNGNVQIFLDGNKITDVTDGSFRSILEVLASGEDGAIILWSEFRSFADRFRLSRLVQLRGGLLSSCREPDQMRFLDQARS